MRNGEASLALLSMDDGAISTLLGHVEERIDTVRKNPPGRYPVLVADDDAASRELLKCFLSDAGYDVDVAADGAEAVERVRRAAVPYLFAFVDVNMPRLSGPEAIAEMHRLHPETLLIVITGGASLDEIHRSFRGGGYTLLRKPFELEAVRRALPSYEAAAAERREKAAKERALQAEPASRKALRWMKDRVLSPRSLGRRAGVRLGAACALAAALSVILLRTATGLCERTLSAPSRVEAVLDRIEGTLARGEGYLARDEHRELRAERDGGRR